MGEKTTGGGTDLDRRVVPVKIRWGVVAGDVGVFAEDVVFDGDGS